MRELQTPTPELVNRYIQIFDEGGVGTADKALIELFSTFPKNDRLEHILLKAVALNTLYSTGMLAVMPMAENIYRQRIDEKLAQGEPEIVNQIAVVEFSGGKKRRNYSFASKYCSWHNPDDYPIYDSFVENLIWKYQKLEKFSDFERNDLQDYPKYRKIIETFSRQYQLTGYGFKDLDKFLWLYGKEYFAATP